MIVTMTALGAGIGHAQRPSAAAPAAPCADPADRETRGRSSVDGKELLWEDDSKYNDALRWAVGKWYQKSGALSRVRIAPDNASSVNDLEWRDEASTRNHLGRWAPHPGVDHIYFNTRRLDKAPFNTRDAWRSTAVHELGHALGLCHKSDRILSIMWRLQPAQHPLQSPTEIDKANYRKLWG
ncbi:matrixin family metalloprotease [Streptomyces candidus]|uniref:Peptidase M10 metallopeptidase domain-containing protein n=1 Tax=Streptomyces candidus TaxID=67283 RepID=A0A7X0HJY7_9ACTN|nr:matrixin family metalloprotease [Streptomyces candidus]MBB6439052.1 hypothetical protein [Streptomyces candidus]GHH55462.1 hypothetical protein GCM10018773_59910 [Streptomyces candidus]